jgi:hypothetical protein
MYDQCCIRSNDRGFILRNTHHRRQRDRYWIAGSAERNSFDGDPDRDGIPNLTELWQLVYANNFGAVAANGH